MKKKNQNPSFYGSTNAAAAGAAGARVRQSPSAHGDRRLGCQPHPTGDQGENRKRTNSLVSNSVHVVLPISGTVHVHSNGSQWPRPSSSMLPGGNVSASMGKKTSCRFGKNLLVQPVLSCRRRHHHRPSPLFRPSCTIACAHATSAATCPWLSPW